MGGKRAGKNGLYQVKYLVEPVFQPQELSAPDMPVIIYRTLDNIIGDKITHLLGRVFVVALVEIRSLSNVTFFFCKYKGMELSAVGSHIFNTRHPKKKIFSESSAAYCHVCLMLDGWPA